MTREELREHCKKQIQHCEQWAEWNREEPHGKVYEEHKLILELLKQEPKTGYLILLDENPPLGWGGFGFLFLIILQTCLQEIHILVDVFIV